jgi:hypothetical protein
MSVMEGICEIMETLRSQYLKQGRIQDLGIGGAKEKKALKR